MAKTLRHSEKEQGKGSWQPGENTQLMQKADPRVFWYWGTKWNAFAKTGTQVKALSSELFSKGSINICNRLRHFWNKGEWELWGFFLSKTPYSVHCRLFSDPNGESLC